MATKLIYEQTLGEV